MEEERREFLFGPKYLNDLGKLLLYQLEPDLRIILVLEYHPT